jgi:hypothetical protein
VDDWEHVERTDVGMEAAVPAQVDPLDGLARAAQERLAQVALVGCQGEDGPAVIHVAVEIEELRRMKGALDRFERLGVVALADIRDREQEREV